MVLGLDTECRGAPLWDEGWSGWAGERRRGPRVEMGQTVDAKLRMGREILLEMA